MSSPRSVALVQRGKGPLINLHESSVEGEPATVGDANLRGDDSVGVQLRVEHPARVLAEHRHGETLGVDVVDGSVDRGAGGRVTLDELQDRSHGRVVGREGPPPTCSSPSAHKVETDFGGENVRS